MFPVPVAAGPNALLPSGHSSFPFVGMERIGPAKLRALLLRDSDELQKRIAGVGVAPSGIADPDTEGHELADSSINAIGFAKTLLIGQPLGDIANDQDRSDRSPR